MKTDEEQGEVQKQGEERGQETETGEAGKQDNGDLMNK
jgi:hypothetical protein